MAKGWGYNNNRKNEKDHYIDSLYKKFDSDKMKVYETQKEEYYTNRLKTRIIFNKENKTIKLILTGEDYAGVKMSPYNKDISNLKTLKDIKTELYNILDKYNKMLL